MQTKNFSIRKAIKFGFTDFFSNFRYYFKFVLAIGLVYIALIKILALIILPLFSVLQVVPQPQTNIQNFYKSLVILISSAIFVLIKYIPILFLISFFLQLKLRNIHVTSNLSQFTDKKRWEFIWIRIKYGLLVGIGFLLLIIPGIYWYLKYYFRGFTFIKENISDAQDSEAARKISNGIMVKLAGFELLWFIPLELIGFAINIPLFISWNTNFSPGFLTIYPLLWEFFYAVLYLPVWILAGISVYKQLTDLKE